MTYVTIFYVIFSVPPRLSRIKVFGLGKGSIRIVWSPKDVEKFDVFNYVIYYQKQGNENVAQVSPVETTQLSYIDNT